MLIFLDIATRLLMSIVFLPLIADKVVLGRVIKFEAPGPGGLASEKYNTLVKKAFWHPVAFDFSAIALVALIAAITPSSEHPKTLSMLLAFLLFVYSSIVGHNNTIRRSYIKSKIRLFFATFTNYIFPYWLFPLLAFLTALVIGSDRISYVLQDFNASIILVITCYSGVSTLSFYCYLIKIFNSYFMEANKVEKIDSTLVEALQKNRIEYMGSELRILLRACNLFSIRNIFYFWTNYFFLVLNLSVFMSLLSHWMGAPFTNANDFLAALGLFFVNILETLAGFSFVIDGVGGLRWTSGHELTRTIIAIIFVAYPIACLIELSFLRKKLEASKFKYWEKA